ncbi:MAG: cobalamin-dependent protein [Ilumatobacteraceae bacterium]|jgi:methanogenic corrinoid protein MtbC1|nr:cobalamin-dependent protein [Ilumatobacteraceae bacterium]
MLDALERYTAAALRGSRLDAADIAAEQLTSAGDLGHPVDLIGRLLAPSQRLVGERWANQLCSVGEEHAATFVTESVLASLAVGFEPEPTHGTIVVACAEGEWHSLPARMAAELLICSGWRVIYLGPATPAAQLRSYLAGVDVDAVGISATITANLPGAARSVAVARKLGLPVVVGGRALGESDHRARALGADGWAADLADGLDLDDVLWDPGPRPALEGDWATIDRSRVSIVRDAIDWLGRHHSSVATAEGSWLAQVVDDLDDIVGVVAAAVLCADPSIVSEHRTWLSALVGAQRFPTAVADVGFDAVAAVVGAYSSVAADLIAAADLG